MERSKEVIGYLNSKFRRRPFFAIYRLTRRCNLRCRMCCVWEKHGQSRELDLDEVPRIAQALKTLQVPYVLFTGGDPFFNPQLPEIIRIFSAAGFHTRIESNGGPQVTQEKLEAVIQAGIIDYSTSLDTLDPAKQDWLCKGQGVWNQAVEKLRYAIEHFPGILPHVNVVVSRHNLEELPDLVKFLDQLGAYSTLVPVVLGDDQWPAQFRGSDESLSFTEADKARAPLIYQELIRLKQQGYKLLNSTRFLQDSVGWIRNGRMDWSCDAGQLYLEIYPDGEVGVCSEIGTGESILDKDFPQRFLSQKFREQVKSLRKTCPGCAYAVFREPSYHIHNMGVLWERIWSFLREMSKWD